jgi:cytochrome c5
MRIVTQRSRELPMSRIACAVVLIVTINAGRCSLAGAPAKPRDGEQIYRQMCASCHGPSGEGTVDHYPKILAGERSITSLAKLIAKTMPEDSPGTCVGPDADRVAAYMYDAFYSKPAQERNKLPLPRIELSRLTVRQYRNAVADLISSFRGPGHWDDKHGLTVDYDGRARRRRNDNGNNAGVHRIDPEVQFQYGTGSPIPEQDAVKDLSGRWVRLPLAWVPLSVFRPFSQEFRANWQGGVLAPETGEYEFVVRTENATRLWINDSQRPLIDAAIKSGNDTEYRESIYLVGGRVYFLKLELNRSKEKTSSIVLLWKRPRRALELIPNRYLSPNAFPQSLIVKTPFPPDDRSIGYERGTSISKAWDQATTDAAIETAGYVVSHLKELAGTGDDAADRAKRLREFCGRFAERAFRRPLSPEQKAFFIDRQFDGTRDLEVAVRRVVLLTLKSPRFLYREIGATKSDAYDVASRLSFGMWDSIPDQSLLDAAASAQLADREQVIKQARRMAGDLRASAKLREFFLQWLRVDQGAEIAKDPKLFPEFDEGVVSDLRTSLELFLEEVIGSGSADFRKLLSADYLYLNGRLAKVYGTPLPADAPFQKVKRPPNEQGGVLSHPYLMSNFAYTSSSSPIHRGVFISRSVLGRALRPPPEAVAPLAADLHPGLTTRQRVLLQTKAESCQSCHAMINSLGFALEHFDAVGRYRDQEKNQPIDATGSYETRAGDRVSFNGLRELAAFLNASDETQSALVQQLFHYLVKQPIGAFGRKTLADLRRSFTDREYNIRDLMIEILATSALAPGADKSAKTVAAKSAAR